MIVVAILAILVSVATTSYRHFMDKAKAVEGEVVVREVERLQEIYHATHHTYADDLSDLGFALSGTLKYYTPEVRVGLESTGVSFQVRAMPAKTASSPAWLLTKFRTGAVQVDQSSPADIGPFASVRLSGHSAPMTSGEATTLYAGSGLLGITEPEWSGSGSSMRCQECGKVVVHRRK